MSIGLFLLTAAIFIPCRAQEAFRMSLAGQEMAEYRKRQLSQQKFNVKLGPVGLRFGTALGMEVTDNVRAEESNTDSDLVLRPQFNMFSAWRVTERNTLTLGLGLGYQKYLNTTEYDEFTITPDSDLSFDIYVGDFVINLHDRFDFTQDVSSDPTVSGSGSLSRFENTIGVGVLWDLNDLQATLGYDHRDYIPSDSDSDNLTHSAELFTSTLTFRVRPTVMAGIELGGGWLDYDEEDMQDNEHIAIGPAVSLQWSEYTRIRLAGGYVYYSLATYGNTNLDSSLSAYYVDCSLNQRVSRLLDHVLRVGRTVQSGIGSDLVELWQIRHTANWRLFRKTGVATTLSYEDGNTSDTLGENLQRYGVGITLSRQLTEKLNGSLGYQFYLKDSDIAGRDYTQNRLVLNLSYAF